MIRFAKKEDLPAVLDLLLDFYRNVRRTLKLPMPDVKVLSDLCKELEEQKLLIVVQEDDKVVGMAGLDVSTSWFSPAPLMRDLFIYISPPYRNSTHGRALIKGVQSYAKIRGLPLILTLFTGEDLERKQAFYKRLGLRQVGGTFVQDI